MAAAPHRPPRDRPRTRTRSAGSRSRRWRAAYTGLMPAEAVASFDVEERQRLWREGLARSAAPRARDARRRGRRRGGRLRLARRVLATRTSPVGELYAIYLDPRTTGATGAGRALIERAEDVDARVRLHARRASGCSTGNERAERFYRAAGWRAATAARSTTSRAPTVVELALLQAARACGAGHAQARAGTPDTAHAVTQPPQLTRERLLLVRARGSADRADCPRRAAADAPPSTRLPTSPAVEPLVPLLARLEQLADGDLTAEPAGPLVARPARAGCRSPRRAASSKPHAAPPAGLQRPRCADRQLSLHDAVDEERRAAAPARRSRSPAAS